jgi:hypothetical protein
MLMNKSYYLIPMILGLGIASLAIAPSLIQQQEAFATAYGGSSSPNGVIANPSGLPESNVTSGNITAGNITGTENITLVE